VGGETAANVGKAMSAMERLHSMLEQIIAAPAKPEMAMLLETHQLVGAQSMAADAHAAERGPGEGGREAGEGERGRGGREGGAGSSLAARFPPICQGMQGFPRDGDVDRVLAANQVSARTTCKLIAELGRRRQVGKAMAVYAYLLAQSPSEQPNLYHYNALIAACQRESRWSTALRLLSEMRARDILPDRITYTSVISACGRGRRWDVAMEVLAEMKLNAVPPSIITYNAVISSCEKAGRLEEALDLMEELADEELTPDLITFSALISTCEKLGDWKRAWEFMRAARRAGLEPDAIAYNSLISACDKGLQPGEAQV
jgi:pentatricopeptide repeat protein